MQSADQDLISARKPNVLPFSASWRFYLGNFGEKSLEGAISSQEV